MQYVKDSVPPLCVSQENRQGKTPWQIFSATHEELMKESANWHIKTSEPFSVVAALVATVAFATSATVPGGLDQDTGYPIMLDRRAFDVFSVSSLSALCLSVIALLFFLAIMSSPDYHFKSNLPRKLLIGLTCLFGSIVAMLVSFFAGHSFVLGEKLGRAALPIYATACAAVTIFAVANLPLFFAVKINLRSLPS